MLSNRSIFSSPLSTVCLLRSEKSSIPGMLRRLIMWSELLKKERSMLVKICLHWKKEYSKFFQPNCRSFVRQLGCEREVVVTGTIWGGLIFSRRKMLRMLGECEFCSKFLCSNKDQIKCGDHQNELSRFRIVPSQMKIKHETLEY